MYKKLLFLISFVLVLSMAYNSYGDTIAPRPSQAKWADEPAATGPSTIRMRVADACDANDMPCQYLFTCTNDGTRSSGWQSSTIYEASGLTPKTTYTFNVQARDSAVPPNTNTASYSLPATTDDSSTPPVLRLDLNNTADNNDANTQPSFLPFVLASSGAEINGVIIDFSVSEGGMNAARRQDPCGGPAEYQLGGLGGDPCNDPYYYSPRAGERIYRDFFSGYGSANNGFTITLWGLGVNQDCNITLWAYDACSTGDTNRVANWYANGTHIFDTNFNGGSAGWPRYLNQTSTSYVDLYKYAWSARVTADSLGSVTLTSTKNATSGTPFCFVDALKVEPNGTFNATHKAFRPQPPESNYVSACVPANTLLKWHKGSGVSTHDLYLGTNYNDVYTATRASHPDVLVYLPDLSADANTGTSPRGAGKSLALDTTYYWRVDENDPGPVVYQGKTWSFTTCPNSVVDDFELYPNLGNDGLRAVWKDFYTQSDPVTSAEIFVDTNTLMIHNRGTTCQMKFQFENFTYSPYYSEARASVDTARPNGLGLDPDWLGMNAKSLTLFFYGKPGNDANQPMYVKLTDGASNSKIVNYDGDMNDIRVASWHEWDILLSAFTGVNLSNVKTLTIGFGNGTQTATDGVAFFDDIQLYATRCALVKRDANFAIFDYAPLGAPGGDCVIDYLEIREMESAWLSTDTVIDTNNPGDANLVVWYPMNEAAGLDTIPADFNKIYNHLDTNHPDVCDPSGKWTGTFWNNGTNPPAYYGTWWGTPDYNSSGTCVYLDGSQGARVQCGTQWNNLRLGVGALPGDINAITVSAWVKSLGPRNWDQYLLSKFMGIAGKRGGWSEDTVIWMFSVTPDAQAFCFTSYPGGLYTANVLPPFWGQWVHLAATYPWPGTTDDPNSRARLYLNGGQVNTGTFHFSHGYDANIFLSIGETMDQNAWPSSPESFYGYIDEVRVYNRALEPNEIAYLANSDPTSSQLWIPVRSPSDVYKSPHGQGVVNFKDYAMVAMRWLLEDMYPIQQ